MPGVRFKMRGVGSGMDRKYAEVAGNDDSFEMIGFNVLFDVSALAFLSTHFANISKLKSIGDFVLAFLHH